MPKFQLTIPICGNLHCYVRAENKEEALKKIKYMGARDGAFYIEDAPITWFDVNLSLVPNDKHVRQLTVLNMDEKLIQEGDIE